MNSDKLCINEILPNEILVAIFECNSQTNGLTKIASVCHQWRELVQTTRSLLNRLQLTIEAQSQLNQLQLIPHKLRLQPRNLKLFQHEGGDDYVSLKDPIWKQMNFGSITLILDSERTELEDVIYFFKEYQRDCNHVGLANCHWPPYQRNKLMESLSFITSFANLDFFFPFPSGIDESFSHLVNLQHLQIRIENPNWRLPKHIAQQLKSFSIIMHNHCITEGFLADLINLKHIRLPTKISHQIMTFMSRNMPKLESINVTHYSDPIFDLGFNPKGLPNLKKMIISTYGYGDICETECNLKFENLETLICVQVFPDQLPKFCRQNSGLKRIEIVYSDLEEIPNLMESMFSHVPNLETFVYDGHLSRKIIGQLTQHRPKLNKLILNGKIIHL